jgi:hypothetical protein
MLESKTKKRLLSLVFLQKQATKCNDTGMNESVRSAVYVYVLSLKKSTAPVFYFYLMTEQD